VLLDRWNEFMWTSPLDVTWATIRCGRQLERQLAGALLERGIAPIEMEILTLLEDRPNLHVGGLSRRLRIPKQTVNRQVRQLSARGVVELRPPHASRRGVARTDDGLLLMNEALRSFGQLEDRLMRIEDDDRRHLVRLLDRVDHALVQKRGISRR
jgi:DNA-binding MarR family transcriptional regulator